MTTSTTIDDTSVDNENLEIPVDEILPLTPNDISNRLKSSLLAFVAKLYASPNLLRNHVQVIVEDIKDLIDEVIALINPAILKAYNDEEDGNNFFKSY